VPDLVLEVPLRRVVRLAECLQEDCRRGDVLAHTELLRKLHAGFVEDVAVDRACPLAGNPDGVSPLQFGVRSGRKVPWWRRLPWRRAELIGVSLRVGERLRVVTRRGVRRIGRFRHRWRWIARRGRDRTHAPWRRRAAEIVVPCAGGVTQGVLVAQEVVDGGGVAHRHAHELGHGLMLTHGLARLPNVGARGVR